MNHQYRYTSQLYRYIGKEYIIIEKYTRTVKKPDMEGSDLS